jgi:hypothetical protein
MNSQDDKAIILCSAPRVGAAAAAYPATGDSERFLRRRCALERSGPRLDSRVVSRRGLLGVESFAVRARFDPDRSTQRAMLRAVNRRQPQFLLEVSDPLSSGDRPSYASDCGLAFHRPSLRPDGQPGLFNLTLEPPERLRIRRSQRSADASDVEIARVDDLVEAEGDESCCRHAEKPTAQPSRLCSEGAE